MLHEYIPIIGYFVHFFQFVVRHLIKKIVTLSTLIINNIYFNFIGVLKVLIEACKPGASVKAICEKGDRLLTSETGNVMY